MSTVRIQVRRGLASEWTAANPVLAAGEMGVETNTNKFKFGNGTDTWTALSYAAADTAAIGEISQDAINEALSVGAGLTKTYNDGANTITITVDSDVIATKAFATSEAGTRATAAQTAAEAYTDAAINGVNNSLEDYIPSADRGTAGGVASLNNDGKILESELNLTGLATSITTSGNVSAENVTVGGNLVVNGTTTTLNTQNFTVEDTLLYIGAENQSSQLDLGFVAAHNTGTYNHTGLVRDASDNKWKLFKDVTDEPTTTVNFDQATLDNLELYNLDSNGINTVNLTVTGTATLPVNAILPDNIVSAAITAEKLATDSVENVKILNGAVNAAKIEDDAVVSSKIQNGAVIEAKIADSAVSTAKIATNAVTADKIATDAVTEGKIADNSITPSKISTGAVTEAKIVANAVTEAKIATDAVTEGKIADNAITPSKISTGAVTEAKIVNSAVTSDKIADSAITNGKVADAALTISKIADLGTSLDAKAPAASPTFTGTVVLPSTTSIGNLTSTEIGYLEGITSSVQTQITAAGTALNDHSTNTTNVHGIADTAQLALLSDVSAVTAATLGLGNVDNTSDANKPVSTATETAIATAKSEAIAEVTAVIDSAPAALNTLNELAAALGDDENFAATVTTNLALKVDSLTPITQKSESYTLSTLDHRDDLIEMGSSSALTLTIPLNSSIAYPVGTSLDILQTGAGQVTIAGDSGVTVNATPGLKLRTQWSSATLLKRAEDTWVVYGDLTA
jgi:hypothetical protein